MELKLEQLFEHNGHELKKNHAICTTCKKFILCRDHVRCKEYYESIVDRLELSDKGFLHVAKEIDDLYRERVEYFESKDKHNSKKPTG